MRPDGSLVLEETAARQTIDRLRLLAYGACLALAFGLYAAVHGPTQGALAWYALLPCAAGLILGLGMLATGRVWLLHAAAASAALVAAAVPLVPALSAGLSMPDIIRADPLWPQILVTLFASRVLSELNTQRLAALQREPRKASAPVAELSDAAALALGTCFALTIYQAFALWPPPEADRPGTVGLIVHALTGESAIHRAIVLLSCIIFAYLTDATLQHRRDRLMLAALRRKPMRRPSGLDHVHHAQALGQRRQTEARTVARATVHGASRRFIRELLPCLPLLGFLGTVVGFATAMAGLSTDGGAPDFASSLSGLALKFETTLLGILASLIGTLLLALLEKHEQEFAALCALIADTEPDDGA